MKPITIILIANILSYLIMAVGLQTFNPFTVIDKMSVGTQVLITAGWLMMNAGAFLTIKEKKKW